MAKMELQSKFLTANQVAKGDVIKILTEGVLMPSPTDAKKKVWNFQVEIMHGTEKTVSFNNTSLKLMITEWGDEMTNWIGKKLSAEIVKMNSFGKIMDVVIWTPVKE